MPHPPATLVRVTLRRAYRFGQVGRVESVVNAERLREGKHKQAMYWVVFDDRVGGAFWEGELEVIHGK